MYLQRGQYSDLIKLILLFYCIILTFFSEKKKKNGIVFHWSSSRKYILKLLCKKKKEKKKKLLCNSTSEKTSKFLYRNVFLKINATDSSLLLTCFPSGESSSGCASHHCCLYMHFYGKWYKMWFLLFQNI